MKEWKRGSWLVKEAKSPRIPLMRSTKTATSQRRTTMDVHSEPVLSSQARWQLTVTMTKWEPFSVTLQTHFLLGMEAQTSPSYPGTWITAGPSWSRPFLTSQHFWLTSLGKPPKLSSTGEGLREARPFLTEISNDSSTLVRWIVQRGIRQMGWRQGWIHGCQWRTTRRREFFDWANMWL